MSDTIERSAAIDAVSEILKGVFVEYRGIAEKTIKKVPPAEQWIPCSTRLPDEEQWDDAFLVTVQCEHVDGWPDYVVCGAEYSAYGWDYLPNPIGAIKVVAWMPINVEPYTERREE